MVCRTTPGGRVLTPHIRLLYGWADSQCTSLYHRLRSLAGRDGLSVSSREYRAELSAVRDEVRELDGLSAAALMRAEARVEDALSAEVPSDADAWASTRMRSYARRANADIQHQIVRAAIETGTSLEFAESEFRRLHSEAPDEARDLPDLALPLPNDVGTRWALHVLSSRTRCSACGQFTPLSGRGHACAAGMPRAVPTIAAMAAAPPASPLVMNMEEFQDLYDAARERIAQGHTAVPEFREREQVSGGVTGGLAAPGGMTFGLEIEVDFPYDTYPYEGRFLLAERLYADGVALTPDVLRWHFLGGVGEGRPGGSYRLSSGEWVCEFDRTVDNVEGERGVELKSQILHDTPEVWRNIRQVCSRAQQLGATPTMRTGLHVNVGGADFPNDDPSVHLRLLRLFGSFDDTLIRLGHNPASGAAHRGRRYCMPVDEPSGFESVQGVKRVAGHYSAVNLSHLGDEFTPTETSSRVEVRLFDSAVDPGRIQANVNLSLLLMAAALRGDEPEIPRIRAGETRSRWGVRKLTGTEWEEATRPFRRLVALMRKHDMASPENLQQVFHLFAESRWPTA